MTQTWLRPATLEAALAALAAPAPPRIFAGGTDILAAEAFRAAWGQPGRESMLDIDAIPGLEGIEKRIDERGAQWRIGARTRWAALRDAALPPFLAGLRQAAGQVGGPQVQNRGTIGGNLCNASPAADGAPPLLALDAAVECARAGGLRVLPLQDFILGNRRIALAPGEMVTAILIPDRPAGTRAGFLKLGARRNLVISIAMVSAVIEQQAGRISRAAIGIGACSAAAQRLPALEAALIDLPIEAAAGAVLPAHLAALAPIEDVRASADYRREAALELTRRLLARLAAAPMTEAA